MRLMVILLEKLCCISSVMIITCFLYMSMDIVFKPWNKLECRLFATGFLSSGFLAFVVVCWGWFGIEGKVFNLILVDLMLLIMKG